MPTGTQPLPDSRTIWYVHPYSGGPDVGRYDRAYHLSRQWAKQGWRSVIIAPSFHHLMDRPHPAGHEVINGTDYEFLRSPTYQGNGFGRLLNMAVFSLQLLIQARRLKRAYGRPAMIIASSPHPYAFISAHFLARCFASLSVFEVRDIWPLSLIELADTSPAHLLVRFTGWLERQAYRHADAVVSLLPQAQEHMIPLGLSASRWHYIPNGIEAEPADTAEEGSESLTLARKWLDEGRFVIVYAGALGKPNHVHTLLQALSRPVLRGVNIGVIVIGRGDMASSLRAIVETSGIEDKVRLFDQVSKSAIQTLLRNASAGYVSLRPQSLFRFGVSPNKLFDYMLASLPIIAAIRAGNDPVAEAGCGYTIDPDDVDAIAECIVQLANKPVVEREAMGARGRDYVLNMHNYEMLANRFLNLLSPRS